MDKRIHLSLAHTSGFEEEYIRKAFSDNWITSGGPNVDTFEEEIEAFLGEDVFVAGLNSGTSAVHLGLILLDVKAGDEVICQSLTFSASANPIIYQGATPVFVDSESETWGICPEALEEAIKDRISKNKRPKAIIAVHLYGMPYKIDEVREVADRYNIPILEDSAEALGSTYKGKRCGTFGDLSVLSFNGNKIITTSSGGVLVTRSREFKEKAIFLSTQSREKRIHYEHTEIGYNYRMSNICAGIGLGQIKVLDQYVSLRRNMHDFYVGLFSAIEGVSVFNEPTDDYRSNHWLSVIIVDPSKTKKHKDRDSLLLFLETLQIESRPLWKPMHLQPIFEIYPYYGSNVAASLFEKGLCLPSGSNLTDEDRDRLESAIHKFF